MRPRPGEGDCAQAVGKLHRPGRLIAPGRHYAVDAGIERDSPPCCSRRWSIPAACRPRGPLRRLARGVDGVWEPRPAAEPRQVGGRLAPSAASASAEPIAAIGPSPDTPTRAASSLSVPLPFGDRPVPHRLVTLPGAMPQLPSTQVTR
jgi:hypothetical protein